MARARKSSLVVSGLRGRLGHELIIKQYDYGTVVSKFPSMPKLKPTALQQLYHDRFKAAVAFAKSVVSDKAKKSAYAKKLKKGQTVYHKALSEYIKKTPLAS